MRIAIQISGEFRLLHFTWHAFRDNILQTLGNEVDIFIHSWKRDNDGMGTFPFQGRGEWHKTIPVYSDVNGLSLYKPRAYEIENYQDKEDLHVLPRSMSMYYSIWRANEVRKDYAMKNNIHYDIVMRYRTDCVIHENPFISLDTRNDILMIPLSKNGKAVDGPVEQDSGSAYCDWLAWGTPKAMDIYCNTYLTWLQQPFHVMPESMLSINLKAHNITKETILQRPTLDFYLVDIDGKAR
jgi:hypothetical protein